MKDNVLRRTISEAANDFATQLLTALRAMPLDELLELGDGKRTTAPAGRPEGGTTAKGRAALGRTRRAPKDVDAMADRIVELLKTKEEGMRAEHIRVELGLSRQDVALPIARALEQKKIRKKGVKRATTYFAR